MINTNFTMYCTPWYDLARKNSLADPYIIEYFRKNFGLIQADRFLRLMKEQIRPFLPTIQTWEEVGQLR